MKLQLKNCEQFVLKLSEGWVLTPKTKRPDICHGFLNLSNYLKQMFKVGDKVSFLNEEGGGVITAMDGNTVTVETEDGFDYEYPASELVKAGGEYHVSEDDVESQARAEFVAGQDKSFHKKFNHIDKMNKGLEMEVDLHIESLISSHKGMTNYEIVQVQMANFRRNMNIAISRKVKKIVFIHGVGAGVLREEIRQELRAHYHEYEYLDGSYQKYGAGATEVLLRKS